MYFTDSHEWVSFEGDVATVGITSYAQKELGDIVFIQLPKVGQKLKVGEEAAVLESTKAAVDIYAPLGGEVVMVHESVRESTDLVNKAPEQEGWLFKLKGFSPHDKDHLLSREAYEALIKD